MKTDIIMVDFTQEELRIVVTALATYIESWDAYARKRAWAADAQHSVHGHTAQGRKSAESMRIDAEIARLHCQKTKVFRQRLLELIKPSND